MSKLEIFNFLSEKELCKVCILRYLNAHCNEFENVEKSLSDRGLANEIPDSAVEENKRRKPNVCIACFGIFQNDMIDTIVSEVLQNTNLNSYDCETIYTSVSVPILVQIRELAIWVCLLENFPASISDNQPPCMSMKEVLKYLLNIRFCKATNRTLEQTQNGILVNILFDHDGEQAELDKLKAIHPLSLETTFRNKKKSQQVMTRNAFDKHFIPQNLCIEDCLKHFPIPPTSASVPMKLSNCTVTGPTIFVAGRYRKLSRALSQSPWILQSKRMMEDSVQEIIAREITPYFEVDPVQEANKINFMSSGREDIDVRCLGSGRPFVLEVSDAKKSKLPYEIAARMEEAVDKSKKVSIQHLQLVKREELVHIKTGEEFKRKSYQALCVLNAPATVEILRKLNIPDGFLLQQMTPLRVLHRRPFLTRPRQIYSVKGYVQKDNPKIVILDIITQAGTYVKELIHGEFGRTSPSISSIIGCDIDIAALDVKAIELDWPPQIDNKSFIKNGNE